jgi:membrane-associated phospholipid phosphatase
MHPVIAAALVAASARAVRDGRAAPVDAELRERITALRTPERDAVVRVATDLGSLYGVGIVSGLVALSGRSRLALRVALSGATAWTLAQAAKPLLPRERPYQSDGAERIVVEPAGTSWPSGHAAVAAAMAATLGEGRGPVARTLLGAVAAAVGVSRVYVGVHHPSDVVAGHGIGALSAALVRRVFRPFSRR